MLSQVFTNPGAVNPPSGPAGDAAEAALVAAKVTAATDAMLRPIDQAIASIQALPWGIHAVIGALFIAGLLLWIFGRHVLQPIAGLVGAGVGACIGFAVLPIMFPSAGLSPYLGLFVGMVIGLLAALLLYKFATALAFGFIVAIATAFITAGVLNMAQGGTTSNQAGQKLADGISRLLHPELSEAAQAPGAPPGAPGAGMPVGPRLDDYPNLGPAARAVRDLGRSLRLVAAEHWDSMPLGHRPWVALFATGALVVAFVLGFFLPKWSAGVVTALLGGGIWLAAGAWLWQAGSLPWHDRLSTVSSINWAIAWLIVGVVGMIIQMARSRRRSAPPPAAPAPA